jgi:hypothetical protein
MEPTTSVETCGTEERFCVASGTLYPRV